jgi:hypothetical protein
LSCEKIGIIRPFLASFCDVEQQRHAEVELGVARIALDAVAVVVRTGTAGLGHGIALRPGMAVEVAEEFQVRPVGRQRLVDRLEPVRGDDRVAAALGVGIDDRDLDVEATRLARGRGLVAPEQAEGLALARQPACLAGRVPATRKLSMVAITMLWKAASETLTR